MGINWKDTKQSREKAKRQERQGVRGSSLIMLIMDDDGKIYDKKNGFEYTILQAEELIKVGLAETSDEKLKVALNSRKNLIQFLEKKEG